MFNFANSTLKSFFAADELKDFINPSSAFEISASVLPAKLEISNGGILSFNALTVLFIFAIASAYCLRKKLVLSAALLPEAVKSS